MTNEWNCKLQRAGLRGGHSRGAAMNWWCWCFDKQIDHRNAVLGAGSAALPARPYSENNNPSSRMLRAWLMEQVFQANITDLAFPCALNLFSVSCSFLSLPFPPCPDKLHNRNVWLFCTFSVCAASLAGSIACFKARQGKAGLRGHTKKSMTHWSTF